MEFEEAKKAFTAKFKEVGNCNWEDDSSKTIVIGTNSYGIEVKVEEDCGEYFKIAYVPYGLPFSIRRLECMHLRKMSINDAMKVGSDAAEWCFAQLEKAEMQMADAQKKNAGSVF